MSKRIVYDSRELLEEYQREKKKKKTSWIGLVNLILVPIVLGLITFGLPERICYYNGFGLDCLYGYVATCVVISFLVVLILYPNYLCKENEE